VVDRTRLMTGDGGDGITVMAAIGPGVQVIGQARWLTRMKPGEPRRVERRGDDGIGTTGGIGRIEGATEVDGRLDRTRSGSCSAFPGSSPGESGRRS
jgi:hypothetical protein